MSKVFLCSLFLLIFIGVFACLQVIPERASATYLNPKYVSEGNISVVRYGRKSKYYINVEGTTLSTWANNVTFNVVFYEYLHNEYRRSFVEMHFKFCDMLRLDPYAGKLVANAGIKCPLPPGRQRMMNITAPMDDFPSVWPMKKARVEGDISTVSGDVIAKGYIYVTFINKKP